MAHSFPANYIADSVSGTRAIFSLYYKLGEIDITVMKLCQLIYCLWDEQGTEEINLLKHVNSCMVTV